MTRSPALLGRLAPAAVAVLAALAALPASADRVTTIDGRTIEGREGQTILEVCRDNGIEIPTLCYEPKLPGFGACRMCVVSVEKARGLQTACTTPVFEGMAVDTESEEARATRRFVLEMLLACMLAARASGGSSGIS